MPTLEEYDSIIERCKVKGRYNIVLLHTALLVAEKISEEELFEESLDRIKGFPLKELLHDYRKTQRTNV